MRYFFEITYDGRNYHGWQSQNNALGVQSVVEKTIRQLLRDNTLAIVGSGRTDTGVHCLQQFFHCDIDKPFDPHQLVQRMNSFLPRDIAIRTIRKVKTDASARYSATERTYEYHITRTKEPLRRGLSFYFFKPINLQTLERATALLLGMHDFQCFSKVKTDVDHFRCDVKQARWTKKGDLLVFRITANRFLRGMVRAIVGTLLDVGTGKTTLDEFKAILKSMDRKKAGMNVPAEGLFLVRVKYPQRIFVN
ncbi:MAG: tRNA pseudouridine(38-40) synthase TruA [Cyclobacteriaceae bacterium]|nr:tRNA pseudouridine(38-40) synthase TruA [Cyclobacteriaceae bacterium]